MNLTNSSPVLFFFEKKKVIPFLDNRRQAMSRNILLGYSGSLVGVPPSPRRPPARPAEHAFRRGFALPAVASSCTSAQERGGAKCAVRRFPGLTENFIPLNLSLFRSL